ncbi:MAG: hypothetical protein WDW36_002036 [Sanguina aurantia]
MSAHLLSLIDSVLGLGAQSHTQTSSSGSPIPGSAEGSKVDASTKSMHALVACLQRSEQDAKAAAMLVSQCAAHAVLLLQAPENSQHADLYSATQSARSPAAVAAPKAGTTDHSKGDSSNALSTSANAMLQLSRCTVGVRGVCLAKQASLLHSAGTPLLQLYSSESLPDAARVAACEALFVMASQDQQTRLQLLGSGAVPAAIKALSSQQASQRLLQSSLRLTVALSQHEAALPLMRKNQLMVALMGLCTATTAQPTPPTTQAPPSPTASQPPRTAAAAAAATAAAGPARNNSRTASTQSLPSPGVASKVAVANGATAAPAAKSGNKKLAAAAILRGVSAPSGKQGAAESPTTSPAAASPTPSTAAPSGSTSGGPTAPPSAPSRVSVTGPASPTPNAAAPCTPLQLGALSFCCNLSAHAPLHGDMLQAGFAELTAQLLQASRQTEVLDLAVGLANNLACGGVQCQVALISAGCARPLVRLLATRDLQVLGRACDAIANLSAHCAPAQLALGAVPVCLPALVQCLKSNQPMLMGKASRALGNICVGQTGHQMIVVKAGALPLLVTLVSCKVPALVRASLSAVACLIGSNAVATQAALKADLMPPLMRIICAARPTAHLPAAPPATALSSQTAAAGLDLTSSAASAAEAAAAAAESDAPVGGPVGGTGSHTARATCVAASAGKGSNSTPDGADGVNVGSRQSSSGAPTAGVSHDVYERAAALLTNVLSCAPEAKRLVAGCGALPALMHVLATTAHTACAISVLGVLNNLAMAGAEYQLLLGQAGLLPQLCRLMLTQHVELVGRACHTLGSVVFNAPELQSMMASAGAMELLTALLHTALHGSPPPTTPQPPSPTASASSSPTTAASAVAASTAGALAAVGASTTAASASDVTAAAAAAAAAAVASEPTATPVQLQSIPHPMGPSRILAADASRAVGNLAYRSPALQARAGQLGAVALLAEVLTSAHAGSVKAGLVSLSNLVHLCPANQDRAVAAGVAPVLVHLLKVKNVEVVQRASYCAWSLAQQHGPAQAALGAAGVMPPLVRLLGSTDLSLVDRAVLALHSLLSGHPGNQKRMAEAGGIQPLAAVLEHSTNAVLGRRALDTWAELGGLPSLVKLLSHRSPSLAIRAAARISALLPPAPTPRSSEPQASSPATTADAPQSSTSGASDACSTASEVEAERPSDSALSGPALESRLVAAGLLPAVVRLCGHHQAGAAEAGLRLLLRLGHSTGHRDGLLDQGCLQLLQGLMLGQSPPTVMQLATEGWQQLCAKPGTSSAY